MDKELSSEYHWYAVYTHSRAEKKVLLLLLGKGIESYVPLQKELKQWSDRKKWVEEPAIRSYVFVRISNKEYFDVLNTTGVVHYIYFEKKPAAIPDKQIEIMKKVVNGSIEHEFIAATFKEGDRVIIQNGILKGITGELVMQNDEKKVLLRISHIGYSLLINLQDVNFIRLSR
jgi:transcription antitermination factor NusG